MYRTSGNPFARILVPVSVLLVVGLPAYFAVVHGNTVDVGKMVYAIPIAAVAIALLATVGLRAFAPAAAPTSGWGSNPYASLAFCGVGILVTGVLFLSADANARAFAHDASCTASFSLAPGNAGACAVDTATITRHWTSYSRGSTYRHVDVALRDGATSSFTLGHAVSGDIVQGIWFREERNAIVQTFRGNVVAISTTSGVSQTSSMPSSRENLYFFAVIFFAFGAFWSAGRILFASS